MINLFGEECFEDKPIKVVIGNTGRRDRLEFYYGGMFTPDGIGHGHVVSNDGVNIHYWRLPDGEGGQVVIDDRFSSELLSTHGVGDAIF